MDHEDDQIKLSSSLNHYQFFTTESTCFWHELKASQEPSATSQNMTFAFKSKFCVPPFLMLQKTINLHTSKYKKYLIGDDEIQTFDQNVKKFKLSLAIEEIPWKRHAFTLSTPKECKFLPWRNSSPQNIVATDSKDLQNTSFIWELFIYYYNI